MNFTQLPKPRKKIIITTSLTAAVALALIAFIVWPSIQDIRSLSTQIEAQRVELETLYLRGRLMKKTLREYHEVQPKIYKLDKLYVQRGDELAFITTLENLATQAGDTQALTLGDAVTATGITKLPVQLLITGTLPQLFRHLGLLEAMDYYVNIDDVRLQVGNSSSIGTGPSTTALTMLLVGSAYYHP